MFILSMTDVAYSQCGRHSEREGKAGEGWSQVFDVALSGSRLIRWLFVR